MRLELLVGDLVGHMSSMVRQLELVGKLELVLADIAVVEQRVAVGQSIVVEVQLVVEVQSIVVGEQNIRRHHRLNLHEIELDLVLSTR